MTNDVDYKLGFSWYAVEALKLAAMIVAALVFWHLTPAWSRPGGDWSQVDPDVRAWFGSVHRPDYYDGKSSSCCGEGDAYEADRGEVSDDGSIYAIVTDNRGNQLPVGTKLRIPPEKVQNKEGNPTGHVIVFANESGDVFCFVPNGGV
jgi:hypothetical protein